MSTNNSQANTPSNSTNAPSASLVGVDAPAPKPAAPESKPAPAQAVPAPSTTWRRNLAVCTFGAFTTYVGMTLIMPILPLYLVHLGVRTPAQVTTWSGVAYAATFITAGITAPIWGYLGDKYGRKLMLIRASLGMAIAMSLIGLAQNAWQLTLLRLLTGLLGGYASGATILVAAQTPKHRSAWALGVLSSGVMVGNIVGPLFGGVLGHFLGYRTTFFLTGALIFITFLVTLFFLHEPGRNPHGETQPNGKPPSATKKSLGWGAVPNKATVAMLLSLSAVLMFALVSVEPIISVHIAHLEGNASHVALYGALVFSLTALGTVISSPVLGLVADRVGHVRVLIVSLTCVAVLFAAQGLAGSLWQFVVLRFLSGLALGGVTPCVIASLRRLIPHTVVGTVLGYNVSAQYVGQVTGPIVAGWVAGLTRTASVFFMTAGVTVAGLCATLLIARRLRRLNLL